MNQTLFYHAALLAVKAADRLNVTVEPRPLGWLVEAIAAVGAVLMMCGMVLCLIRLLRGPHLADRAMAADLLSFQVAGLVLVMALTLKNLAFFDVMLVVAILGFVTTVAFSQYISATAQSTDNNSGDTKP